MEKLSIERAATVSHLKAEKLDNVNELFFLLHKSRLSYCHWKSNEHLDASMRGETDLDILFDVNQQAAVEEVLALTSFKRFVPVSSKRYKDIEDYIGLDAVSGKIVHVHAHFRLTMGEPYLKGFQLNVERKMLETRILDSSFQVYRTEPAFELVLLFCRLALKLTHRDKIKIVLKPGSPVPPNLVKEYTWLRNQCTAEEIARVSDSLFHNSAEISKFFMGAFNREQFYQLSKVLRSELRPSRIHHPFTALLIRWQRELIIRLKRKIATSFDGPVIHKRIHPQSGLVIAVIGADGTGKSTVVKNLYSSFSKKLDVYKIYFGNGGYVTLSTKLLKLFGKKKRSARSTKKSASASKITGGKEGFLKTLFKCLDAIELAMVKNTRLKRMCRAKKMGMLVICDRFPQDQVNGYNDGPHLQHLLQSPNMLFRWIATRERAIFSKFNVYVPDIVFKLSADAKLIESRKPGQTPMHILESKLSAIRSQRFPRNCFVDTIDASARLDRVLRCIKSRIWEFYR